MRAARTMVAALTLLAGCAAAAETLVGSGHAASEQRPVEGFHALAVSVPAQVELVQGNAEGLRITADDNVLARVQTVVEHGVLRIRFPRGLEVRVRTPIEIEVHARAIDHITLAGAVRLTASGLKADRLAADLAGSAMITLPDLHAQRLSIRSSGHCHGMASGRVERFELGLAGAGEINAARLEAAQARIAISGSAQVAAWVHERLDARITGSGAVRYFGDAAVAKRITGAGIVERLGAAPP